MIPLLSKTGKKLKQRFPRNGSVSVRNLWQGNQTSWYLPTWLEEFRAVYYYFLVGLLNLGPLRK